MLSAREQGIIKLHARQSRSYLDFLCTVMDSEDFQSEFAVNFLFMNVGYS